METDFSACALVLSLVRPVPGTDEDMRGVRHFPFWGASHPKDVARVAEEVGMAWSHQAPAESRPLGRRGVP